MRLHNKYKIYNQVGNFSETFHQRLLKFKRPKWKKIQKNISILSSSKKFIVDNFSIKNSYKSWDKIKGYYKLGVKSRNNIYGYFDRSINTKDLTHSLMNVKNLGIRELILNALVKAEFRIDVLIWRLGFFVSSYQARQAVNNKLVLVNGKAIVGNFFLRKGDIITFSSNFNINRLSIESNRTLFSFNKIIFTFVEIDYYTNTLIIIKDLHELSLQDICLLNSDFHDLKKVKDLL